MKVDPDHLIQESGESRSEFAQTLCRRQQKNRLPARRVRDPVVGRANHPLSQEISDSRWCEEGSPNLLPLNRAFFGASHSQGPYRWPRTVSKRTDVRVWRLPGRQQ